MLRVVPIFVLIVSIFVFTGCGGGGSAGKGDISQRMIKVVATTGMVADLVKNIGGDRIEVNALMGPGTDPHQYKASERDVSLMSNADIIFFNGLHLEGAMAEVLEKLSGRTKTFAVGGSLNDSLLISPKGFKFAHDPHIWFDVSLWMRAGNNVAEFLIRYDSLNAGIYRKNTDNYRAELVKLHEYILEQANRVSESQRVLITAHDAFNYFGRAYGFEVRGLQGISTASEAGTADVQNLAEFIAERRIAALFVESSVPRRSIEAVQAAVKSKGYDVAIGGQLFSDALGNTGTPEGTYLGMVRYNIDTIVKALLGEQNQASNKETGR